jgi:hypothetical protein
LENYSNFIYPLKLIEPIPVFIVGLNWLVMTNSFPNHFKVVKVEHIYSILCMFLDTFDLVLYFLFFLSSVNVNTSAAEERVLLTGLHEVADVYCDCCKTLLGWKYEHAFESSQKYKEGKYIIELVHMIKDNGWDEENIDYSKDLKK